MVCAKSEFVTRLSVPIQSSPRVVFVGAGLFLAGTWISLSLPLVPEDAQRTPGCIPFSLSCSRPHVLLQGGFASSWQFLFSNADCFLFSHKPRFLEVLSSFSEPCPFSEPPSLSLLLIWATPWVTQGLLCTELLVNKSDEFFFFPLTKFKVLRTFQTHCTMPVIAGERGGGGLTEVK